MTTADIKIKESELRAAVEVARLSGDKQALCEAWNAANDFTAQHNPPKAAPARSSRAGRRQAAERRAQYGRHR